MQPLYVCCDSYNVSSVFKELAVLTQLAPCQLLSCQDGFLTEVVREAKQLQQRPLKAAAKSLLLRRVINALYPTIIPAGVKRWLC